MGICFGKCCISGVGEIAKGGVDSVGGLEGVWYVGGRPELEIKIWEISVRSYGWNYKNR